MILSVQPGLYFPSVPKGQKQYAEDNFSPVKIVIAIVGSFSRQYKVVLVAEVTCRHQLDAQDAFPWQSQTE